MRTQPEAIDWARDRLGRYGWDNLCLSFVRQAFGIDYPPGWDVRGGAPDWPDRNAGTAWDRAKYKHRTTDPLAIPRGVPVFYELPSVPDHVVLSLGNGQCLSNDFVAQGRIDQVSIAAIAAKWGPLLGWTEDLLGQRVVPAPAPPKPVTRRGPDVDEAQAALVRARRTARGRRLAGIRKTLRTLRSSIPKLGGGRRGND